jgi:(E)-4-hydroxy-3-methylbut-2-enyl-diphosphate synthase
MQYCVSSFTYHRRFTREVMIGRVGVGGVNPIRVQSMITCDTMDTEASIAQTMELAEAGCEIVRITAPTVKDAANLEQIVRGLRARGCDVPIVADIHFKPEAALEAANWVEKVRINPGNYADSKKFKIVEYTDDQYAAELERIRERFTPLVRRCRERGVAMRIGTNHGSLSDRIMNRYGDTPLGMVESAIEFAQIARDLDYHAFVFSMKSSNPKVMINAYRLLVARLNELSAAEQGRGGPAEPRMISGSGPIAPAWNYPIHLGVTEAGEGEDARIKSAIGIGSLLHDGIGDTIRVSLTEDSIHEIPVARALVEIVGASPLANAFGISGSGKAGTIELVDNDTGSVREQARHYSFDPFSYQRRGSKTIELGTPIEVARSEGVSVATLPRVKLGGEELIRIVVRQASLDQVAHKLDRLGDYQPEIVYEKAGIVEIDPRDEAAVARVHQSTSPLFVTVRDDVPLPVITAFRLLASKIAPHHPILLKDRLRPVGVRQDNGSGGEETAPEFLHTLLRAATNIGSLLCDGIGDAVLIQGEEAPGQALRLSYNILQAAGSRIFKTDYVACPSCGRTLFNLQTTTARIKAATLHLKGVKIAIMGCIVNGPGEMADADFGYVGGAPGKVNLYVGKTAVKFNIPEADAVERLQDLIREHGKWVEPAEVSPVLV